MSSIISKVKVSRSEPVPLHDQVAAEIRRSIAAGEGGPGERLPPAKDLAAELGVNSNTVLRALRLLRDEGLLEFRRGRGVTVTGTRQRGLVVERARDLVTFARSEGIRREEPGPPGRRRTRRPLSPWARTACGRFQRVASDRK